MKVLIVANYNAGYFSPFVIEQVTALQNEGVEIEKYGVVGKGFLGYLSNIRGICRMIRKFQPDLIHAHYGLSGLCANLQRKVPVVTTYHGSDVHSGGWILKLSQIAMRLSAYNIFVNRKLLEKSKYKRKNTAIVPCGVSLSDMPMMERVDAKKEIGREQSFVLFAGAFDNDVKNAVLAQESMRRISGMELVELKGYSRQQVKLLMNAADCMLMTSHREGSPQVIKEAMACGTPIVSVDVGDVKEVIGDIGGCYIAERNPDDIADKIRMALAFNGKTKGRQRIIDLGLSNDLVAKKLISIYHNVLKINDVK